MREHYAPQSDDTWPPVTPTRSHFLRRRQHQCRLLLACVLLGFALGAASVWAALELAVRAMA